MNHHWFCFVELYLNAKHNFVDQISQKRVDMVKKSTKKHKLTFVVSTKICCWILSGHICEGKVILRYKK